MKVRDTALPILSSGELVGTIIDRDIAVRGVAAGVGPDAPVHRIMTDRLATCSPDDDIETVLLLMAREQVRRMPACDEQSRVVGMIALADLAGHHPRKREVAETLEDICEPSGMRCQAPVFA